MQTRNNYTEALGQLRVHVMEMGGGSPRAPWRATGGASPPSCA